MTAKQRSYGIIMILIAALLMTTGCTGSSDDDRTPSTNRTGVDNDIDGVNRPSEQGDLSGQLRSASPNDSGVTQGNYQYVASYMVSVIQDLDQAWTAWFIGNGLYEPMVSYTIITPTSGPFTSSCQLVVSHDTKNAYYCSEDISAVNGVTQKGMLILPETTFYRMWNGDFFGVNSGVAGDFGAAGILAHEFGHHVQDEIKNQRQLTPPQGKNAELIADCFAGNWVDDLYQRKGLDESDLQELVAAIQAIGDPTTEGDHGTGAERLQALKIGFNSQPISCIQTYWPQALAS